MENPSSTDLPYDWTKSPVSFDYFQSTLDRIIGFVNSCDVKASIVLGIFGIVLSSLFSNDILENLFYNLSCACKSKGFFDILYIIIFTICTFSIIYGLYSLISTISARINISNKNSYIYFVDIANNSNVSNYNKALQSANELLLIEDFVSQIYINSEICTKKYKKYNRGLKYLSLGVVIFLITNLIMYNIYVLS